MSQSRQSARRAAIYLLDHVLGENRLMSELLGGGALDRFEPGDRARAQRLTMDTLRGIERADRLLQKHLRKNPPLHVRNVLRLGTVELVHGGDAHGIVNEAVDIVAANRKYGHMKGMVNAVLRKMAAEAPHKWADLRAPRLPKWLRSPLVEAYNGHIITDIEAVQLSRPPLDITAKSDVDAVAAAIGGEILPTGSIRLKDAGQVSALAGFDTGDWWVQDAAAAIPANVLAAQDGETVLDLCAAPGGKTLQLAARGARVTALDISENRLTRVRENLSRTGLKADVVAGDALDHHGVLYDAILLDAPCSATGTIRRHPDLPYAKDGGDFGELIALQSAMLDHALGLLKPGGRLVFCTCSLLPDEGECQIDEALERHKDLRVDRDALAIPGVDPNWITSEGGLRLRPDYWAERGGMDGFYIACLRRDG